MSSRFTLIAEHPAEVRQAAEYAARYILERLEPELLDQLIRARYPEGRSEEYEQIRQYCQDILNGEMQEPAAVRSLSRRALAIARKAELSLMECNRLDVGGFLTFRLRGYQDELKDTIEYVVEEHMSNKHYKEFIALLKYFVHCQAVKIPEVHLIHEEGNVWLVHDHRGRPVEMTESDEVIVETVDRELNYEDRLLSTLIASSPKHVYVHTRKPDTLSIKTIQQIFDGRTTVCCGCERCRTLIGEKTT